MDGQKSEKTDGRMDEIMFRKSKHGLSLPISIAFSKPTHFTMPRCTSVYYIGITKNKNCSL